MKRITVVLRIDLHVLVRVKGFPSERARLKTPSSVRLEPIAAGGTKISRTPAQQVVPCRSPIPPYIAMGEDYRGIGQAPNKNTYSTPCEGNEKIDGGRLVFQRLDALLDEGDATGFIGDTFDQREIGLVLREGPPGIRGLVGLSQVIAGNGIVGAERDGFFE